MSSTFPTGNYRVGSAGVGSSTQLFIPSDLVFSGVDEAACIASRDAFFTAKPKRLIDGVVVEYRVIGSTDVSFHQWNNSSATWVDITDV